MCGIRDIDGIKNRLRHRAMIVPSDDRDPSRLATQDQRWPGPAGARHGAAVNVGESCIGAWANGWRPVGATIWFRGLCRPLLVAFAVTLIAAFGSTPALSQVPTGQLRIIVPFPPGGSSDLIARMLNTAAAPFLPSQAIIENKAGAGGNIGTAEAARSRSDGSTIVQCSLGTCAANPWLYASTGYDVLRDFKPIMLTAAVQNVLVVRRDLPVASAAELVQFSRKHANRISYGSAGYGASNHLGAELMRATQGLDWVHVPYRGNGPAITDLIGGRIDLLFDNLPTILPHIRSGAVKVLAVASDRRAPELPDVPTLADAGIPGVSFDSWFGFMAPAGTADAALAMWSDAFNKALQQPALRERFRELGFVVVGGSPEDMRRHVESELTRWGELITRSGIRMPQ